MYFILESSINQPIMTKLRLNNISDSEIIQVTGHFSTNSLKSYTRIDNAEAVSNVKSILDGFESM